MPRPLTPRTLGPLLPMDHIPPHHMAHTQATLPTQASPVTQEVPLAAVPHLLDIQVDPLLAIPHLQVTVEFSCS